MKILKYRRTDTVKINKIQEDEYIVYDKQFESFVIKRSEITQVERIQISYSKTLSEICQRAKKLWKSAVFYGRQVYFLMQDWEEGSYFAHKHPAGYELAEKHPDVVNDLVKFVETDDKLSNELRDQLMKELKHKLFVNKKLNISSELRKELTKLWYLGGLYRILKDSISFHALAIYFGHLPTQLLRYVEIAWIGYKKTIKIWRKNPDIFLNGQRPTIPNYGRKYNEFSLSFPGMEFKTRKGIQKHFNNTKRKLVVKVKNLGYKERGFTAELLLPKTFLDRFPQDDLFPPIRTRIELNDIVEVRIVPKKSCYEVQITYKKSPAPKNLDLNKVASVDIGLNEMMAITII